MPGLTRALEEAAILWRSLFKPYIDFAILEESHLPTGYGTSEAAHNKKHNTMAKTNTAQKSETPSSPNSPKTLVTRPGLRKHSGDVVGFHDPETQGHIFGIPRGAKASDSKLDETKPSLFIIFELLEDCKATEGSEEDATEVDAKVGDMVGVWVKGGMRGIKNMCGLKVLMQHTGEKKLKGKPAAYSPMKTYQFDTDEGPNKRGTLIPIIEDNRDKSRNVRTFLDPKKMGAPNAKGERQPGEDDDDDFDFPE